MEYKPKYFKKKKSLSVEEMKKIMVKYNQGYCKICKAKNFCQEYIKKYQQLFCEVKGDNAYETNQRFQRPRTRSPQRKDRRPRVKNEKRRKPTRHHDNEN